jgi:hypothetical protein
MAFTRVTIFVSRSWDRRRLNRATPARQVVLDRVATEPRDVVGRLVGLRAQDPDPPYVGLWCRVAGFAHDDLTTALERRDVVCATLWRGTQHPADRRRLPVDAAAAPADPAHLVVEPALTVDGFVRGVWRIDGGRSRCGPSRRCPRRRTPRSPRRVWRCCGSRQRTPERTTSASPVA